MDNYKKIDFWFCKPQKHLTIPLIALQFEYLSSRIPNWDQFPIDKKILLCDQYKNEIIEYYNFVSKKCDCDDKCDLVILNN